MPPMPTMPTAAPELDRLHDQKALARYARTGDPRAFEVITHRYQGMVLATCRRTLRDLADAEDAAQETFLKLAKSASTVRSNVAAWLHATAHRTAIDLLRTQQSQARAEKAAASQAGSADDTPEEQAWKDLEPELDEALNKLDADDRELIVARFLAGRQVTQLAKAHKISKGAMSRRIDKALKKLRGNLESSGFALAAGISLPAVLACSQAEAGPALSLVLGKVGLAGMTSCGKPALLASLLSPAVIAATLGVTVIAGSAITLTTFAGSGSSGAETRTVITLPAQETAEAPERPARAIDGFAMTGLFPSKHIDDTFVYTPEAVTINTSVGYQGDRMAMALSVVEMTPSSKRSQTKGEFQFRIDSVRETTPSEYSQIVGGTYVGSYVIDSFGRLIIDATINTPEGPNQVGWIGIRPPSDHPLHADIPDDAGPSGIEGPWMEFSDWGLRLEPDNIAITSGDRDIHRFRILEWETATDHARVQTICTDSMAPGMVGERVKLLLRKDKSGYTIVYNERNWNKLNQWPSGFNPDPRNQNDNGLLVRAFSEAE